MLLKQILCIAVFSFASIGVFTQTVFFHVALCRAVPSNPIGTDPNGAALCDIVRHCATLCDIVRHRAALCDTERHKNHYLCKCLINDVRN
jgi:hypothetical protein